ncbi:MAG: hypothetical protein IJE22_07735 [Oscillibacter sp.]|nr:hypothetical protein [Oscillibacter sp.]
MIPMVDTLTGGALDALFVYLSILGMLLLVATILRLKVPFLKKYHIPAALIAGVIGLILGPYFLNIIPKTITTVWSNMSGRLIVLVFAPMLMGKSEKLTGSTEFVKKSICSASWCYLACAVQYALPILLTVLILTPVFGVDPLFGATVEAGWAGGHGTAAGMAAVYEELGWMDGQSLAVTSATFGLAFGIIGGVILINVGVRKGWAACLNKAAGITNDEDELYVGENRPVNTRSSVSAGVVDNFAFHAAILSVAVFVGYILNVAIKKYTGISISWFVTALFGGLFLQKVLDRTPWGDAVDKATLSRIQGIALEFLVAGAVASVNVSVVIEFAIPLLLTQGTMAVMMIFLNTWYARRTLGDYWFEQSMVLFGTFTGVAATGMLLLKTCDPEAKSDALTVYAARAPFTSWAVGGGLITSLAPVWIAQFGGLVTGLGFLAAAVVCFLIPVFIGHWKKHPGYN